MCDDSLLWHKESKNFEKQCVKAQNMSYLDISIILAFGYSYNFNNQGKWKGDII